MQMLTMIAKQLKLLLRNRLAILATICLPLILTVLFSFSQNSSSKQNLYIADLDKSSYSEELTNMLKNHKELKIINCTEAELKKKVDDQEIPLGFLIEKDFGSNLVSNKSLNAKLVQNYENGESTMLDQTISGDINTFKKVILDSKSISDELKYDNTNISSELLTNIKNSSNVSVDDTTIQSGETNNDSASIKLIGFLVMFIWFVVIQGFRTLIDEKENHTFNRLLSTPISYTKYFISKVLATYIFGLLHIGVILLAASYFLKINIVNNIFSVGIIFAAYLFLLTGLTLLIVLFIKNQQRLTISSGIVIVVTGMLGGCFFPMEIAPSYMQTISKFTPQAWVIQTLKNVLFNNSSITSQIIPLTIFIALGICALIISVVITNSRSKLNLKIN